jgi:hypothetical protein
VELFAVSNKTQNPILKDFYLVPLGQGQNIIIEKKHPAIQLPPWPFGLICLAYKTQNPSQGLTESL